MENPFLLTNKVIIVTGASSGIGKQSAISCAKFGAKLVLIGRNMERLQETLALLDGDGHLIFSLDVTNSDELESLVEEVFLKLGSISGFIHSAGFEITKPINATKSSDYTALFATNVIAGFDFARILSKKKYINNKGVSLVFISSVVTLKGQSALIAYAASKGALISGVKSMAVELASKNIRANCISSGWIAGTGMTETVSADQSNEVNISRLSQYPLGYGQPEDVATACIYLLSDAGKWVTGINLIVDGGYSAK